MYTHATQLRNDNIAARGFAMQTISFRKREVCRFLNETIHALSIGRDAGIGAAALYDMARNLHDNVGDAVGQMRTDCDNNGIEPEFADIDMDELDALLASLEAA